MLAPGGRLGLTDLTKAASAPAELEGLLAWIACIGDAQPAIRYEAWLRSAHFDIAERLDRSACLLDMIHQVSGRLLIAEVMTGLRKLELPGFDPAQAKQFLAAASRAIAQGELGYVLFLAAKSHTSFGGGSLRICDGCSTNGRGSKQRIRAPRNGELRPLPQYAYLGL